MAQIAIVISSFVNQKCHFNWRIYYYRNLERQALNSFLPYFNSSFYLNPDTKNCFERSTRWDIIFSKNIGYVNFNRQVHTSKKAGIISD